MTHWGIQQQIKKTNSRHPADSSDHLRFAKGSHELHEEHLKLNPNVWAGEKPVVGQQNAGDCRGPPVGDSGKGSRRFWPVFAGVLQTLENKAPILFNFAPILSDLAFLQIRQNQTNSARPLRADPFWEFPRLHLRL